MIRVLAVLVSLFTASIIVNAGEDELRTFLAKKLNPYMDVRVFYQGASQYGKTLCLADKLDCMCFDVPQGIDDLKVSTLINTFKVRSLSYKERKVCESLMPEWQVASNWWGDTRPVKYLRTLPHPNDATVKRSSSSRWCTLL